MRLATYNVENLFERAKAMNLETWDRGGFALADYQRLNTLIQETFYSEAIKSEMLGIMERHKGLLKTGASEFIRLRDLRGEFLRRPRGMPVEIAAAGRNSWIGWFELEHEPLNETATENIARVIDLLEADVLCVIEAEDRTGLKRFNEDVMPAAGATKYDHVMLIDGNDDRGIDVGIMARGGSEIVQIRSHVDDADEKGTIFSRDCAEYVVRTPKGNDLVLLVNHFKSKGYGKADESNAKRLRQARRVLEIYNERIQEGFDYVAVVGDLNEVPDGAPLAPLLRDGARLTDIMAHPKFVGDGRPGTHGNGTKSGKLDYILLSPKLAAKVVKGGIERRGVWGGKNGTLFEHLPTVESAKDAASDHAALWAEVNI